MIHKAILTFAIMCLVVGAAFLDGAVACSTQFKNMLPKCERLPVSPSIQALLF